MLLFSNHINTELRFSFGIAVVVYLIGGCAYQRTVMHQRGWRQCPNSGLWVGMLLFFKVSHLSLLSFSFSQKRNPGREKPYKSSLPCRNRGWTAAGLTAMRVMGNQQGINQFLDISPLVRILTSYLVIIVHPCFLLHILINRRIRVMKI